MARTRPPLPDFRRAAHQRLAASEILLKIDGLGLECMYLAGYAVECALKAMIVSKTPASRRKSISFRGKPAHNFDELKKRLRAQGSFLPEDVNEALRTIATWTTDLRYSVGIRPYDDAKAFVDSAKAVVSWMERSL